MQLAVLPAVEMSFPLKVKLLPEVLLHVACPTYCHKRGGAAEQVGDLWWMEKELRTTTASWKSCMCRCKHSSVSVWTYTVFVCDLQIRYHEDFERGKTRTTVPPHPHPGIPSQGILPTGICQGAKRAQHTAAWENTHINHKEAKKSPDLTTHALQALSLTAWHPRSNGHTGHRTYNK